MAESAVTKDYVAPGDEIPEEISTRDFARALHSKVGEINERAERFYSATADDLQLLRLEQAAFFFTLLDVVASGVRDQKEIAQLLAQNYRELRADRSQSAGGVGFVYRVLSGLGLEGRQDGGKKE